MAGNHQLCERRCRLWLASSLVATGVIGGPNRADQQSNSFGGSAANRWAGRAAREIGSQQPRDSLEVDRSWMDGGQSETSTRNWRNPTVNGATARNLVTRDASPSVTVGRCDAVVASWTMTDLQICNWSIGQLSDADSNELIWLPRNNRGNVDPTANVSNANVKRPPLIRWPTPMKSEGNGQQQTTEKRRRRSRRRRRASWLYFLSGVLSPCRRSASVVARCVSRRFPSIDCDLQDGARTMAPSTTESHLVADCRASGHFNNNNNNSNNKKTTTSLADDGLRLRHSESACWMSTWPTPSIPAAADLFQTDSKTTR